MTQPEPYPDFAGLRTKHVRQQARGVELDYCGECGLPWPCDAKQLLDHIGTQATRIEAALAVEVDRVRDLLDEARGGATIIECGGCALLAVEAEVGGWTAYQDGEWRCPRCESENRALLTSPSQVEHRHLITGETSTDCPACLASPSQEAQPCGINVWLTQQIRRFCVLPRGHEGMHSAEPVAKGEAE